MDIFQIPDDYKPEKPLTDEEVDDITSYLKNHPLFMKEAPQNIEGNQHLVALKAVAEEQEDPNQTAELLNQGSHLLKTNPDSLYHMKEAYKRYTKGIATKSSSSSTNAKLHANRASINLKLKNYGKVIQDCKMCLKYDNQYTKAYYRYAKALNALKKYNETLVVLQNRKQQQLVQILIETNKILEEEKYKSDVKLKQQQNTTKNIQEYCLNKKWKLIKRSKQQQLPPNVKLEVIDGKLAIPIIIYYPQFNQFDVIAKAFENDKLKAHLQPLFETPLPYDQNKQYSLNTIEIFAEIQPETIMKIPKQCTVDQVLQRVPLKQCLELSVVRSNNTFYSQYIKQNKVI